MNRYARRSTECRSIDAAEGELMFLALVEGREMLDVGQLAAGDREGRLDEEKDRPIQRVVRVRKKRRMLTTETFHAGDERNSVSPR